MHKDANALNWFEIPVSNMERARKFYETIFGIGIPVQNFGSFSMGFFPSYPAKLTGALCLGEHYIPCTKGALIYLNANPDLSAALGKIEPAGGKIVRPKTQISPEHGFMALFTDTEGNRMALHSNK